VSAVVTTKTVKQIWIDLDKCTGCRACEMACSAFHAKPRYSSVNPARSRIRVVTDEVNDEYVPVRAGNFTRAECDGRHFYHLNGKQYSECSFCRAACPSRDYFIEPDSGLPLKCDMCEDEPALAEPLCVTVCQPGCLTYKVRVLETEANETEGRQAMERGLESLVNQHGMDALIENVKRLANGQ
jgi:benzoyl-CoA reductase subunit BamC